MKERLDLEIWTRRWVSVFECGGRRRSLLRNLSAMSLPHFFLMTSSPYSMSITHAFMIGSFFQLPFSSMGNGSPYKIVRVGHVSTGHSTFISSSLCTLSNFFLKPLKAFVHAIILRSTYTGYIDVWSCRKAWSLAVLVVPQCFNSCHLGLIVLGYIRLIVLRTTDVSDTSGW